MMAGHGLDSAGSRQGQVRGFCEHGIEYSHPIICVESNWVRRTFSRRLCIKLLVII